MEKMKQEVSVYTANQVAGEIKVFNWNTQKHKWDHTKEYSYQNHQDKFYLE